jgi:tRNA nucleotidyltransferase (CCA-adding enzyme)
MRGIVATRIAEREQSLEIYEVGGAVRDSLLGRPVADRDWVVTGATAEDMLALGYRQVGRDFPVFLHPETHEEYALARLERKQSAGYRGFSFDTSRAVTLEQDLARRDVTVNAMARDSTGRLIDPYGGQADLAAGLLRHITPAFAEDPLRVLRVARFAARFAYTVHPQTLALMQTLAESGELDTLTPERVWRELERALSEPHPAHFFSVLRACGALAVLFPEIEGLFALPPPMDAADEANAGMALLSVLDRAAAQSAAVEVRFALLMLPTAALASPPEAAAEALSQRLRVPVAMRELAVLAVRHRAKIAAACELDPPALMQLLLALDALRRPERLRDVLAVCALTVGAAPEHYEPSRLLQRLNTVCRNVHPDPAIAATAKGPAIRDALNAARTAAVARELALIRNASED